MKNITLKIDEATYDRARMEAARRKTSVSGLVREYLVSLDPGDDREARRVAALKEIYAVATARAKSHPGPASEAAQS